MTHKPNFSTLFVPKKGFLDVEQNTDVLDKEGTMIEEKIIFGSSARNNKTSPSTSKAEVFSAQFRVTISIGVAELLPQTVDMEQLLNLADQAFYRAKQSGRNQVST